MVKKVKSLPVSNEKQERLLVFVNLLIKLNPDGERC
jgi:hypothetical protein